MSDEPNVDIGLLAEWQEPGSAEWEIVTLPEVNRRMQQVEAGERPGPVSHAGPPGVLSGMTWIEAEQKARAELTREELATAVLEEPEPECASGGLAL